MTDEQAINGQEEEVEEVTEELDPDEELDNLFASLEEDDDEEEPEESEETEEEPEEEPEEETEEEPADEKPKGRVFTQEEVNKIVGQARIKGREVEEYAKQLEQMTGMPLPQITDYIKQQQVNQMVEEHGVTQQEAERIVEDRQVPFYFEQQVMKPYNQQRTTHQKAGYNNEKMKFNNNTKVKKYEAEIDAISQGGQQLGFEAAMKYVLGEKAVTGDLMRNIKEHSQKPKPSKPKIAPVSAGAGGAHSKSVPKELRALSAALGVDVKEAADEYFKEQKRKRR